MRKKKRTCVAKDLRRKKGKRQTRQGKRPVDERNGRREQGKRAGN